MLLRRPERSMLGPGHPLSGGARVRGSQQGPLSVHTPWLLLPGVSPWVHHFAVHWCPLNETCWPPVYAVVGFHGGAVQPPGGLGEPVVGGGDCGGVAPANRAVNVVNSQSLCGTLEQVPEVRPLLSGGLHCRSRLTDQNVNRLSRWLVA